MYPVNISRPYCSLNGRVPFGLRCPPLYLIRPVKKTEVYHFLSKYPACVLRPLKHVPPLMKLVVLLLLIGQTLAPNGLFDLARFSPIGVSRMGPFPSDTARFHRSPVGWNPQWVPHLSMALSFLPTPWLK